VAVRAEKPVPEGWVIDADGRPLTDPQQIMSGLDRAAAALLPLGGAGEHFGGYKGYGLATMVEILSASLSGGVFMKDLLAGRPTAHAGPTCSATFSWPSTLRTLSPWRCPGRSPAISCAPCRIRAGAGPGTHLRRWRKEHEMEKKIRASGIPVNRNLRTELQIMRDELGIGGYESYIDGPPGSQP